MSATQVHELEHRVDALEDQMDHVNLELVEQAKLRKKITPYPKVETADGLMEMRNVRFIYDGSMMNWAGMHLASTFRGYLAEYMRKYHHIVLKFGDLDFAAFSVEPDAHVGDIVFSAVDNDLDELSPNTINFIQRIPMDEFRSHPVVVVNLTDDITRHVSSFKSDKKGKKVLPSLAVNRPQVFDVLNLAIETGRKSDLAEMAFGKIGYLFSRPK